MATLMSWGRYPVYPQTSQVSAWRGEISTTLSRMLNQYENILPFGNGRSYGDSCLAASGQVLHTASLNKFIKVDWDTGIILAESGVSLDELLKLSIPKGWFLPVTPGTKFVTLGGMIVADVHGKNHHRVGSMSSAVDWIDVMDATGSVQRCSRDENADLFHWTLGEHIPSAKLLPIAMHSLEAR